MKIWTDNKGNVRSSGFGSIGKQQRELIAIMAYIQQRVDVSATMVERAVKKNSKREPDDGVIGGTD